MSLKKDYHGKKKIHSGPGGFQCDCCNPYRKEKPISRRYNRRVDKQNLRKEIEKALDE